MTGLVESVPSLGTIVPSLTKQTSPAASTPNAANQLPSPFRLVPVLARCVRVQRILPVQDGRAFRSTRIPGGSHSVNLEWVGAVPSLAPLDEMWQAA